MARNDTATLSCDLWGCGLSPTCCYVRLICVLLCISYVSCVELLNTCVQTHILSQFSLGEAQRAPAGYCSGVYAVFVVSVPALLQSAPKGRFDDHILDVSEDGHEVRVTHRLLQNRVKVFPLVL